MQRISVDLPDPDGPHRTIFSPARTVKLMFVRALKSPYHFSTPSMTIMGCEELSDVLCMFIALTLLLLSLRRTRPLQRFLASPEAAASSIFHRPFRVRRWL